MGPGSLIQYFHRTAKDFLGSDEIWAKLVLETAKMNFNPNVAMMGSHLWCIEIRIAFSAESAQNFVQYDVEASPHVAGFMVYAFLLNWQRFCDVVIELYYQEVWLVLDNIYM